jgi:hypothetical protein
MQSDGNGLTFEENDLLNAKRLIGLLNRADFAGGQPVRAALLSEGYQALAWFNQLLDQMKANMFEIISIKEPPKEEKLAGKAAKAK